MNPSILFKRFHQILVVFATLTPLILAFSFVKPAYAGGTVTNCNSPSDFVSKVAGGGTVTFSCGPNPPTILLTTTQSIIQNTTINGGSVITLSGGNNIPHFYISPSIALTLTNIAIVKGYNAVNDGGSIYNDGSLNITNSKFYQNATSSPYSGGAIVTYGPLTIDHSEFAFNLAGNGGALFPRFSPAVTSITNSNFHDNYTTNTTNGWGGAMLLWDGPIVTIASSQINYNNAQLGGAIYTVGATCLTITGTHLTQNSANPAVGGAIYNSGLLTITNSTMDLNTASDKGGAIFLAVGSGTTKLEHSTFSSNNSTWGAAIANFGNNLILNNILFDHNGFITPGLSSQVKSINPGKPPIPISTNSGGALFQNLGNLRMTGVTMNENTALYGGGIDHEGGNSTLTNVTLSGNYGAFGGGGIILNGGVLTVTNATIVNNITNGFVGGIDNPINNLTVRNTILSNSGANCAAPVITQTFNLSSDNNCGFGTGRDQQKILLGNLAYNGGFTPTFLPLKGSLAIDNAGIGCPSTDQRGVSRPQGAACDVGSVEYRAGDVTPLLFLPTLMR